MDMLHHLGRWFAQGTDTAVRAYTRASDAYAQDGVPPSVAEWSVVIAAALVLLEWVVSQRPRGRR
jgi:hypothetical protein